MMPQHFLAEPVLGLHHSDLYTNITSLRFFVHFWISRREEFQANPNDNKEADASNTGASGTFFLFFNITAITFMGSPNFC